MSNMCHGALPSAPPSRGTCPDFDSDILLGAYLRMFVVGNESVPRGRGRLVVGTGRPVEE